MEQKQSLESHRIKRIAIDDLIKYNPVILCGIMNGYKISQNPIHKVIYEQLCGTVIIKLVDDYEEERIFTKESLRELIEELDPSLMLMLMTREQQIYYDAKSAIRLEEQTLIDRLFPENLCFFSMISLYSNKHYLQYILNYVKFKDSSSAIKNLINKSYLPSLLEKAAELEQDEKSIIVFKSLVIILLHVHLNEEGKTTSIENQESEIIKILTQIIDTLWMSIDCLNFKSKQFNMLLLFYDRILNELLDEICINKEQVTLITSKISSLEDFNNELYGLLIRKLEGELMNICHHACRRFDERFQSFYTERGSDCQWLIDEYGIYCTGNIIYSRIQQIYRYMFKSKGYTFKWKMDWGDVKFSLDDIFSNDFHELLRKIYTPVSIEHEGDLETSANHKKYILMSLNDRQTIDNFIDYTITKWAYEKTFDFLEKDESFYKDSKRYSELKKLIDDLSVEFTAYEDRDTGCDQTRNINEYKKLSSSVEQIYKEIISIPSEPEVYKRASVFDNGCGVQASSSYTG